MDTLGLPTVFFTHSAADLQWPELAQLICPDDLNCRTSHSKALNENPAIADWFFNLPLYHQVCRCVLQGSPRCYTDYWMRFEWQHRGSPHLHGVAWLKDALDDEKILNQIAHHTTGEWGG